MTVRCLWFLLLAAILVPPPSGALALTVPGQFRPLHEHRQVLFEKSAEDVARQAARLLPNAVARVEREHFLPFVTPPELYICGSRETFRYYTGMPDDVLAAVPDRVYLNGPEVRKQLPRLPGIVAHELSHLHLQQRLGKDLGKVPYWFVEGLAVRVSGGSGAEKVPEGVAVEYLLEGRHFLLVSEGGSLSRLVDESRLEAPLLYRQAALFVGFLQGRDDDLWRRLLVGIEEREPFSRFFRGLYGMTVDEAWRMFLESLRQ